MRMRSATVILVFAVLTALFLTMNFGSTVQWSQGTGIIRLIQKKQTIQDKSDIKVREAILREENPEALVVLDSRRFRRELEQLNRKLEVNPTATALMEKAELFKKVKLAVLSQLPPSDYELKEDYKHLNVLLVKLLGKTAFDRLAATSPLRCPIRSAYRLSVGRAGRGAARPMRAAEAESAPNRVASQRQKS